MATTKRNRGPNFMLGILMILMGSCIGLAGSYYAFQSFQLVSAGRTVDAVVVDLDYSPKPSAHRTAAPIYEYTVDGETYRFQSATKSYPYLKIGEHQTLLYDPNNPAHASENDFNNLWLIPAIACPASVVLMLAAILVVVVGRLFGTTRKPPQSGFSING